MITSMEYGQYINALVAPAIPVLIVSYRNVGDVVECLAALQRLATEPAFDIYVCENGGGAAFDELVAALIREGGGCADASYINIPREQVPAFVRTRCLRLQGRDTRVFLADATENFGYAGAINAWLRFLMASPSWPGVWVLNPDTQPEPGALAALVAWSAARGKGMVGSRIVTFSDPHRVRTRGLRWQPLRASTMAVGYRSSPATEPNPDEIEALLDAPSGVSIYVTRDCLDRVGCMDERYFLYFEDLEWGSRAKHICGVGYAHNSVVKHRGGTTIGSSRCRTKASPLSVYLEFRNRVLFVRRRSPAWLPWTLFVLLGRALEYALVGAVGNMRAALAGLNAAIAGETGRPDRVFDFDGRWPNLRTRGAARFAIRKPSYSDQWQKTSLPLRADIGAALKRQAKVAISCIVFVAIATRRRLRQMAGLPNPHQLVILYYHGVAPEWRANFVRQLERLKAGYTIVGADYCGAAAPGGRSVAITFDDALKSVIDNALPALVERRIPATIFIPAGAMGKPPCWDMEHGFSDGNEIVATESDLRAVTSDLVQLGGHSLTHPHLPRLPAEEARQEIEGCRQLMRRLFDAQPAIFAFPYGEYDAAVVELCREAGYHRVFTSEPRIVDPASNEFVRGRVLVDPSDGSLEFKLKVAGAYSWMVYFSAAKKWARRQSHRSN